jgi:hypothetical protein
MTPGQAPEFVEALAQMVAPAELVALLIGERSLVLKSR